LIPKITTSSTNIAAVDFEIETKNGIQISKLAETLQECEYVMAAKTQGQQNPQLAIYHKDKLYEYTITMKDLFSTRLKDNKNVIFPFKNCRFANIGDYLILTGGSPVDSKCTGDCYSITPSFREDGEISIQIKDLPMMSEKRERHNMIYLPSFKTILVCCGFTESQVGCETLELNKQHLFSWRKICNLKEHRGNATMAFIDNRYVYCISGFKVNKSQLGGGKYLNSFEVLDYSQPDKVWGYYEYDNSIPISLCAMGVIPVANNKLIMLGGFDGSKYVNTYCTLEFDKIWIKNVDIGDHELPNGVIFAQSSFVKSGNRIVNFDYQHRLIDIHFK
jgi:hypothetical protein